MKVLYSILSLVILLTPTLYLLSSQQNLSTPDFPIVVDGTLTLNYQSKHMDDTEFSDLMKQVQQANDYQQSIQILTVNVTGNQIQTLDLSNLNHLPKLKMFTLDISNNQLNGKAWEGFQNFQKMENLLEIDFNLEYQGTYSQGQYGQLLWHPSLSNVDFIQNFNNLTKLKSLVLQLEGNSLVNSFEGISALKSSQELETFVIDAPKVVLDNLKGFEELRFENLKVFSVTLQGNNSDMGENQLKDFFGSFKKGFLKQFYFTLIEGGIQDIRFLNQLEETQNLEVFYLNLELNGIESLGGMEKAFRNMSDKLRLFDISLDKNKGFKDIQALENMENATQLEFFQINTRFAQDFSDISALNILQQMSKLIEVNFEFSNCSISNIDPLQYLSNSKDLKKLNLYFYFDKVKSVEPLNSLLNLNNLEEILITFVGGEPLGYSQWRKQMQDKFPFAMIYPDPEV